MGYGNQFKTVILLGVLTALLLFVGQLVGGPSGLTIALIFALVMNFGSYWFSDKIVLKMYKAKPVSHADNPRLFKIVKDVSHLAGLPMPKVYIMDSPQSNAFATGRNPNNAAVAATTGILHSLNDSELKGVMAHEMAHIKNRDTLIATIAATIAGVISYIAFMARWGAIFGGFGRDNDDSNIVELLALAILTPLIATIIQLAISRSREYLADETAAKMTHSPYSLADALAKLQRSVNHAPFKTQNKTGASLFIVNPFSAKGFTKLFSTHPPMDERIRRLKSMH